MPPRAQRHRQIKLTSSWKTFENTFVWMYTPTPAIFALHIDNIFVLWNGDESSPLVFQNYPKPNRNTIKITWNHSSQSVIFFDVTMRIVGDEQTTNSYQKPTDRHQVLLYESYHLTHEYHNMPYQQNIRLHRIFSYHADYEVNAHSRKQLLVQRRYPVTTLDDAIEKPLKRTCHIL